LSLDKKITFLEQEFIESSEIRKILKKKPKNVPDTLYDFLNTEILASPFWN
jgi:hypothetical protein